MQMNNQSSDKEISIKQLKLQLLALTKELNKTTEQLQLLELHETQHNKSFEEEISAEDISELVTKQNRISHEIITIKKKIQKLSAKTILKTELLVLPIIAVLLFYGISDYYQTNTTDLHSNMKTRYLIENLQGSADVTPKYWNLARGAPLTVSIINPDHLSQDKIDAVKAAILSTDVVHIDNSLLNKSPQGGKSEYFTGWKGALSTVGNTEFYVPTDFDIVESDNGPGQIVITLSHLEDPDGYSGYTRSVIDDSQILKSFITIYDADRLTDNQITVIVRHEFGHALGLPHTSDPEDLMHATIQTDYPFVSQCDAEAIQSLYNNGTLSNGFCNTQ